MPESDENPNNNPAGFASRVAKLIDERISTFETGAVSGAVIGPYRLLELIGEGGMGEVWLAEQKQPVRRRVALKLIKAGMDTREVVARFESERQALALMDHPAIAKVFDAGSTPQGRPYFVMEYVSGVPITTYCDTHKLTTRERLELFIHVCEAVQHAHQKAIIHRDLKPSNILVTEVDGKPVPKIIDFGIAKATAHRLTAQTMYTSVGALLGTPEYMSPEQVDRAGVDIDTRTDVYSLGVVLHELLVGAVPLDIRKLPFEEMLRKLREEETARPSTKVRTSGAVSTAAAENRRTDVRTLALQLRGDLDAIVLKAVEKDRARRYGTPSDLAADIGRYLRNEPVVARPASLAYRARKYVRRHRIAVAVATAAVVLLGTFAVMQTIQLRRITRERDRADRITNFMTSMFKVSDPSEARGNKITAREILDKASEDIDTGLANDPELQAQMMNVMAKVYDNLGLYSRAGFLLRDALNIQSRVLGPNNPATLKSMIELGWELSEQGRYSEAEKLERSVLSTPRSVLGRAHPETSAAMHMLGSILEMQGKYAEAEKVFRQALVIRRRGLGPEHRDTLMTQYNLASAIADQGRYAEAEKLDRETLAARRRVLGPEHPDTLMSMNNLASTLGNEGHWDEAEQLFRENLEIQRRVLGPEHPQTALSVYNLGSIAAHKGNTTEALSLLQQAVDHGAAPWVDLAIEADPDLKSLHGDPRFATLVAHAKEKAAAAQRAN